MRNRLNEMQLTFERQVMRGNLKEHHVPLMTAVAITKLATEKFGKAYFGRELWEKATDEVTAARHDGNTERVQRWERLAPDLAPINARLARETILTTLDTPAIMGRARDLALMPSSEPYSLDSYLFQNANRVVRTDFRKGAGINLDIDSLGTFEQPQGANVEYKDFEVNAEEWAVKKYSRAIGYAFEQRRNDDIGLFLEQAEALGYSARLQRLVVMYKAITDEFGGGPSTPTTVPGAAAGGPTIPNITWAAQELADSNRRFGAISVPPVWMGLGNQTANNPVDMGNSPALNLVANTFTSHVEDALGDALDKDTNGHDTDWLAYDARVNSWLTFGALEEFVASPLVVFKLPDVRDTTQFGSFDNMTDAMKVLDVIGAKVTDASRVLWVAGE